MLAASSGAAPIRIRLTGTSSTLPDSVRGTSAICTISLGTWRGEQSSRVRRGGRPLPRPPRTAPARRPPTTPHHPSAAPPPPPHGALHRPRLRRPPPPPPPLGRSRWCPSARPGG